MRPDHHTAAFSGNMHGLGWSPYKYKLEYWTALPLPIYGLVRPQFLFQCFRPCLDRRKFKEKLWYYSSLDISQKIKHSLKPMVFVSFTVGWGNTSEKNLHRKKHERKKLGRCINLASSPFILCWGWDIGDMQSSPLHLEISSNSASAQVTPILKGEDGRRAQVTPEQHGEGEAPEGF